MTCRCDYLVHPHVHAEPDDGHGCPTRHRSYEPVDDTDWLTDLEHDRRTTP